MVSICGGNCSLVLLFMLGCVSVIVGLFMWLFCVMVVMVLCESGLIMMLNLVDVLL